MDKISNNLSFFSSHQLNIFFRKKKKTGKEYNETGHTKGAIAFDNESGFWMVHSVPHYPPAATDGYGYPHTGHKYGQMYLCITLNSTTTINDIGLQLRYNNPDIHDQHLPESMKNAFPNINELVQGTFPFK